MAREYKDSGIAWIGEIPSHWKVVPFKSVYSLGKGLTITKADLVEKGVPVISYGQIHSKENNGTSIKDELIRFVPESYLINNQNCLVNLGDVIFADTSEDLDGCGNCVYVDRKIALFAGYHTIIATNHSEYKNKYFSYLFKTDCWRLQIRSMVNGVKLYSVPQRILSSTSVIIPPLPEQRAIADYLDRKCGEIDELISLQEKIIEELKAYKQSVITEAVTKGLNPDVPMKDSGIEWIGKIPVGWSISKIKYIGEARNGLTYSPQEMCGEGEGLLVLRSSNIQNDQLCFNDNVFVNKEVIDELMMKEGDILICSRNGSASLVGKCTMMPKNVNATFGAFMMRFRPFIHRRYALYLIRTTLSKYKELYTTSTINQLTNSMFGNMLLPLSTVPEQQAIADYLDTKCSEIDALIVLKQTKIEELKDYKKSIIYECVTGKIEIV